MNVILALISVILLNILLSFYLMTSKGYSLKDLSLFFIILFPNVWLSRFEMYYVTIRDLPFGLTWGVILVSIPILLLSRDRQTKIYMVTQFRRLSLLVICLALVLMISTIFNSTQINDVIRGFHACCFILIPFFFSLFAVLLVRFDDESFQKIIYSFMLVGIFTGVLSILSAVAPGLFSSVVTTYKTSEESGRAFTPIGGPSATSMYLLLIYCLATGQLMAKRTRLIAIITISICFLAILSSLARAAIITFVICNLFLYGRYLNNYVRKILVVIFIGIFVLLPLGIFFSHHFSLERLITYNDHKGSIATRSTSIKTAFIYGSRHLLSGGGWGLVYPLPRVIYSFANFPKTMTIDGLPTAFKPHCLFGLVFAEGGIISLILLLIFFWNIWKYLAPLSNEVFPEAHWIIHGFRSGFLAILIMSIFQDHLFLVTKLSVAIYMYILFGIIINNYYRNVALKNTEALYLNYNQL